MLRSVSLIVVALLAFGAAMQGCEHGTSVHGESSGHGEAGIIAVRWGEPGSGLVHGVGRVEGGAFFVEVNGRPPAAAFANGTASGELVLLPVGAEVHLGQPLLGERAVADKALIFRDDDGVSPFPLGLSCAISDEAEWSPTSCDSIQVAFAPR